MISKPHCACLEVLSSDSVKNIVIGSVGGGELIFEENISLARIMSEKQECAIAPNRTAEIFEAETKTSEFNVSGIRKRLGA